MVMSAGLSIKAFKNIMLHFLYKSSQTKPSLLFIVRLKASGKIGNKSCYF